MVLQMCTHELLYGPVMVIRWLYDQDIWFLHFTVIKWLNGMKENHFVCENAVRPLDISSNFKAEKLDP